MADNTAIEWAGATWNPVTGCTRVSPGCAHCYIETTIPFRTKGRKFKRVGNEETTGVELHHDRLDAAKVAKLRPLDKPIFVCSLADLFHEHVPDDFIAEVFTVMGRAAERTFQVLTKRPVRARDWFASRWEVQEDWPQIPWLPWPLSNVWIGTSIENARYTWRADVLREIPAAVRFISAEPLLGSLFPDRSSRTRCPECRGIGPVKGDRDDVCPVCRNDGTVPASAPLDLTGIDWLIVGGESGGRFARPMHPQWARELRDASLDNAFFFKQHGSWSPVRPGEGVLKGDVCLSPAGERYDADEDHVCAPNESEGEWLRYRGASPKSGGRLLDGVEWNEMPEAIDAQLVGVSP